VALQGQVLIGHLDQQLTGLHRIAGAHVGELQVAVGRRDDDAVTIYRNAYPNRKADREQSINTAAALARSGVAALTLVDLDHVAESNINRQVQALDSTLGMAKVEALRRRIADIHPGCVVHAVEEFVEEGNWPGLLVAPVDVVIDACDQVRAKAAIAAWALATRTPLVAVGAAGGKRAAERVEVGDLAAVTHDPVLAGLRQRLRKLNDAPRIGAIGIACVFSREPVEGPGAGDEAGAVDGTLNCHGYGSSVGVTATFGMVAATRALEFAALAPHRPSTPATL